MPTSIDHFQFYNSEMQASAVLRQALIDKGKMAYEEWLASTESKDIRYFTEGLLKFLFFTPPLVSSLLDPITVELFLVPQSTTQVVCMVVGRGEGDSSQDAFEGDAEQRGVYMKSGYLTARDYVYQRVSFFFTENSGLVIHYTDSSQLEGRGVADEFYNRVIEICEVGGYQDVLFFKGNEMKMYSSES